MKNLLIEKIPDYVLKISAKLKENDFSCYLVGGPVRDLLMNKTPDDFDLCTDAKPEDIISIFPKSVSVGAKFGTIIVLSEDSFGENHNVEVTTFRSEADYVDGRWPTKVEFTDDLYKDLGRRDFTINAMAVNLQLLDDDIPENDIVDLFNGISDLKEGIIRAVGTPLERFEEDGLRSFRACRLASQLNFIIETETFHAIKKTLSVASNISVERIRNEFVKLLMRSPKPSYGINLLKDSGLLDLFLPELVSCIGVEQPSEYHVQDVYNHILSTVDVAEDSVKLAALFHDIGKPSCDDGNGHFYGHDIASAEMAELIMKRMKFPNSEIKKVRNIVRWHMFVYSNWREDEVPVVWSDSAIRRFIKNIGGEEYVDDLIKLRIADALGNPKTSFNSSEIVALQKRISEVLAQEMALSISDLDIRGEDIISLGIEKGPKIGEVLNYLLEEVIDNPSLNTKEQLIKLVESYL